MWEEAWSCCGKLWQAKGCTLGFHYGVPTKDYKELCTNTACSFNLVGDIVKPLGGCYKRYSKNSDNVCESKLKVHTGTYEG